MPYIARSSYTPPLALKNAHIQTIYSGYIRKTINLNYHRERLTTPDDDFLDLDWSEINSDTLVIISHGMLGNSSLPYVRGMVKACNEHQMSALAWNNRGCSGEPNRHARFYSPADTSDLEFIIEYASKKKLYRSIFLIGFSMGGSITLKYLSNSKQVHSLVRGAVAISAPCDHYGVSLTMLEKVNHYYHASLIKQLKEIFLQKENLRPGTFDKRLITGMRNFGDWVNNFLVPLYNFKNPEDYWTQASNLHNLSSISLPTLMISAQDDTILSKRCYPFEISKGSKHLYLETPEYGGHVGFALFRGDGLFWSELRSMEFIQHVLTGKQ